MEDKGKTSPVWVIAPANGPAVTIDPSGQHQQADHEGQSVSVADITDLNLKGIDPNLKCEAVSKCAEVVFHCPSVRFSPCEVLVECTNVTFP